MIALGLDTETKLIRPGLLAPPVACVTLSGPVSSVDPGAPPRQEDAIYHGVYDRKEWVDVVGRALSNPAIEMVGANLAYDVGVIAAAEPDLLALWLDAYQADRCRDVQIDEMLTDIAEGNLRGFRHVDGAPKKINYSLADLSRRYLGKDRFDQKMGPNVWRLRYGELFEVPLDDWPDAATHYAIEDAVDSRLVRVAQRERHGDEALADGPAQARAALALHLMSCWGVRTDREALDRLGASTKKRFDELTERLVAEGLVRSNGVRDTKAAKKRIVAAYAAQGLEVPLTETGELAAAAAAVRAELSDALEEDEDFDPTDYASLERVACEDSGDPVLVAYAERVSLQGVLTGRIPGMLAGTVVPIQPRYNVLVETGRTSCSAGRTKRGAARSTYSDQIQNVRRLPGLRECYVARPGYLFVDCDFSQLELHCFAQVLFDLIGDTEMGHRLNRGEDEHLALGARILGIDVAEAKARKKDADVDEARGLAKVPNFGFPGGLGATSFVHYARKGYGIELAPTRAEAEDKARWLKALWLQEDGARKEYFRLVGSWTEDGSATVQHVRVPRVRGRCRYTQACNSLFQGLGSDVAKRAIWEVCRRSYGDPSSALYGMRPWGFIHDQVVAEVPEDQAHEAAVECARAMVEAGNALLPDVPVRCSPAVSKSWCKKSEGVYDAQHGGRLVPWDIARAEKRQVWRENGEEVSWK